MTLRSKLPCKFLPVEHRGTSCLKSLNRTTILIRFTCAGLAKMVLLVECFAHNVKRACLISIRVMTWLRNRRCHHHHRLDNPGSA